MFHTDGERAAETARLNDLARTNPQIVNVAWFTTRGVAALVGEDPGKRRALVEAVAGFGDFGEDNDPYGDRDFGAFTLWGERLFWKIDYYHPERDEHSPAKWSAELTHRVLTLMLASEYWACRAPRNPRGPAAGSAPQQAGAGRRSRSRRRARWGSGGRLRRPPRLGIDHGPARRVRGRDG